MSSSVQDSCSEAPSQQSIRLAVCASVSRRPAQLGSQCVRVSACVCMCLHARARLDRRHGLCIRRTARRPIRALQLRRVGPAVGGLEAPVSGCNEDRSERASAVAPTPMMARAGFSLLNQSTNRPFAAAHAALWCTSLSRLHATERAGWLERTHKEQGKRGDSGPLLEFFVPLLAGPRGTKTQSDIDPLDWPGIDIFTRIQTDWNKSPQAQETPSPTPSSPAWCHLDSGRLLVWVSWLPVVSVGEAVCCCPRAKPGQHQHTKRPNSSPRPNG